MLGITCFFVYDGKSGIKFKRTQNLNFVNVSYSKEICVYNYFTMQNGKSKDQPYYYLGNC